MSSKKNVESIYPLSPQQKGMLLESLSAAVPGLHLERLTCVLHGELDLAAFEHAWEQVIARHSIFRTAFAWKGRDEPLQVVLERVRLPLTYRDLNDCTLQEQEAALSDYLRDDLEQGFDMTRAPLMRLALFRTDDYEHLLVWTHHHILMDGWCRPLVAAEFSAFYGAFRRGAPLSPPPTRPYRDYIAWLRAREAELPRAERFWRDTLSGLTGPTPLGEPAPPPPLGTVPFHGTAVVRLPAAETSHLRETARQRRLTLNTVVQGAWALLLSRYSGRREVVFGTTVSGRPSELEGVETMIGLFINTLPFRVPVPAGERLWSWLEGLQARHLEARAYEHCSAGQIHQWSGLPGSAPLYDSLLVFENYPIPQGGGGGEAGGEPGELGMAFGSSGYTGAITRHPLTLIAEEGTDLVITLIYDGLRLEGDDVTRAAGHLRRLLAGFAAEPDPALDALLELVPAGERPRLRAPGFAVEEHPFVAPRTATEKTLAAIWSEVLGLPQVGVHDSFLELGGHSLLATRILARVNQAFGIRLPLLRLFEAPTLGELAAAVAQAQAETAGAGPAPAEVPRMPESPLEPGTPVPLTDIQETYWIGRSGLFDLGGSGANIYLEYEFTGSAWSAADDLGVAMRRLVERHPILRTVVDVDGALRLLSEVPPFEVEVEDLSWQPEARIAARLERVRDEMRYARAPLDQWPLFRMVLHQVQDGRCRLHARFDALVLDGATRGVLRQEILQLVNAPDAELPPLEVSFLDHARALDRFHETETWARSRDYWMARLPELPPPLQPPVARAVGPETVPRVVKRQVRMLEPEGWREVRRIASRAGASPTALLATAFSETVRPWSATPGFTLGLVGSFQPPIHPQIGRVLGNFNTVQLLAVEAGTGSFENRAQRLQQRLATDLEHQAFSGHRVLRELNRRQRNEGRAALPVLFDSVVEYGHAAYRPEREEEREAAADGEGQPQRMDLVEVDLMISLPQVLLLAIALEDQDGRLSLVTQAVEEVLAPGCVPDLLDRLRDLLARLAAGEAAWKEAPAAALLPAAAPPAPPALRAVPAAATAPGSLLEIELAGLWEEVLGRRPAALEDDFYDLGGDSLRATRLMSRLAARFGLEGALADFLAQPTLGSLGELVERTRTERAEKKKAEPSPVRRLRDSLATFRSRLFPRATGPAQGMRLYLLLWLSQFVSGIGTGLGSFALGVWVYRQNASATQYAMIAFVATCTALLVSPLAGVLADRWDRRKLILLGDSGAAVMTCLMALALYTDQLRLWHVYIIVTVMVGFSALQVPALIASTSMLVPRRQLGRVGGMTQAASVATGLICPPLSGALVGSIGYHGVILIDLSTFLFAFVVILSIRLPRPAATTGQERRSVFGDVLFGWTYIRQRPGLLSLLGLFAATNFSLSIVQVLLTPLVLSFGSATNLGFVNSASAAGALLGSLALSLWGGPRNRVSGILLFVLLQAPILFLGALQPSVMLIAVAAFVFMGLSPFVGGLSQAIWQSKVAHDIQGRVFAMRGLIVSASAPLAFLLAGPLADRVFEPLMAPGGPLADTVGQLIGVGKGRGVGLLFMTLGLFIIAVVLLSSLNPRLRKVEAELPDAHTDPEPVPGPTEGGVRLQSA